MFLQNHIERLYNNIPESKGLSIGCTADEINLLEKKMGFLPKALSEFLAWGGHKPVPFQDEYDLLYEFLLSGRNNLLAERIISESKDIQPLFHMGIPANALVLMTWQGYQFWFIYIDKFKDDPAVYYWSDEKERTNYELKFNQFSDFFAWLVDNSILIYKLHEKLG